MEDMESFSSCLPDKYNLTRSLMEDLRQRVLLRSIQVIRHKMTLTTINDSTMVLEIPLANMRIQTRTIVG